MGVPHRARLHKLARPVRGKRLKSLNGTRKNPHHLLLRSIGPRPKFQFERMVAVVLSCTRCSAPLTVTTAVSRESHHPPIIRFELPAFVPIGRIKSDQKVRSIFVCIPGLTFAGFDRSTPSAPLPCLNFVTGNERAKTGTWRCNKHRPNDNRRCRSAQYISPLVRWFRRPVLLWSWIRSDSVSSHSCGSFIGGIAVPVRVINSGILH